MALTPSNPFERGTQAPYFSLPDTISNEIVDLKEVKGSLGTVIFFICNHCPYVIHVQEELVKLAHDYQNRGFTFLAISSNDVEKYPQDAPAKMKLHALDNYFPFPYLYDETQDVAKAYNAACTPDFYIFDQYLKSVYHGQLDDSRPGNKIPVTGKDIRAVLEIMLSNRLYTGEEKPSMGCSIKWK